MTTVPKTLSLGAREWNALLAHNATELATFFNGQPAPNVEAFKQVVQHMERMKEILPGWLASGPAVAPEQAVQQAQASAAPQTNGAPPTNGAAEPAKKRGGWPKGKKRGAPRAEAMQ